MAYHCHLVLLKSFVNHPFIPKLYLVSSSACYVPPEQRNLQVSIRFRLFQKRNWDFVVKSPFSFLCEVDSGWGRLARYTPSTL